MELTKFFCYSIYVHWPRMGKYRGTFKGWVTFAAMGWIYQEHHGCKGHKVGDTVEDVIWVKVQDPIILDDSGGHDDLHLAGTSVHRVPRQLGLKNREQVACRCFANR